MKKIFYNAKIVTPYGVSDDSAVVTCDGVIVIVGFQNNAEGVAEEKIDCNGNYLLAGFVDIHCHGGGGADFMDGSVEAMETAVSTHLSHGTTTICPTTMSAAMSEIENTFSVFRLFKQTSRYATNALGLHLEGPFLSPKMVGARRHARFLYHHRF